MNDCYAPVAQLDRVFDYESKGRGFESLRAHQKIKPSWILSFPSIHEGFFMFLSGITDRFPEYALLVIFHLLILLLNSLRLQKNSSEKNQTARVPLDYGAEKVERAFSAPSFSAGAPVSFSFR